MSNVNTKNDSSGKASAPVVKGGGSFVGGVAALGGGAVIAHVIAFGCAPIISRLFAPEAFGAATVAIALFMILGHVASLRYEAALMLPEKDEEAANLFFLCVLLVAAVSVAVFIAFQVFGGPLSEALRLGRVASMLPWAVSLGVFLFGLSRPLEAWTTRQAHFQRLGSVRVGETFFSSLSRIVLGAGHLQGAATLLVTSLLAHGVAPLVIGLRVLHSDGAFLRQSFDRAEIQRLAVRYIRFPLWDTFSTLLTQISNYLPLILLGAAFGSAEAGYFSRAVMLVQLPLLLIGNAVGQVLFQRAARKTAAGETITELVEGVLHRLIWLAVLPLGVVALIGPELLSLVLGSEWRLAGVYAAWLAPWLLVATMTLPLVHLLNVFERLGEGLVFHGCLIAAQVASLLVGGWWLRDTNWAVGLFSVSGVLITGGLLGYLMKQAHIPVNWLARKLTRYIAFSLPTFVVAAIVKWGLDWSGGKIILLTAFVSVSYWMWVLRDDAWAREMLLNAICRIGRWKRNEPKTR